MKHCRFALVLPILALVAGLGDRASAAVSLGWEAVYDSPYHGDDTAKCVVVDHDDNIIVTGSIESIPGNPLSTDVATVKYNPAGETLWARHGLVSPRFPASPEAITCDDQNNIYVVGTSSGNGLAAAMTVVKYRPSGDTAWVRRFPGPCCSAGRRVLVDAQHNVYAAGSVAQTADPDSLDFLLVKCDSNGTQIGTAQYLAGPVGPDSLFSAGMDPEGNIILVGSTSDPQATSRREFLTAKFGPNLALLWSRGWDYGELQDDYPVAVTTDNTGNIYVCGACYHTTTLWDYEVVKYDPAGDTLLTAWYNNDLTDGTDIPCAIAVDKYQNIYVTGTINDTLDGDPSDSASLATVKFGPAGGLPVWIQKYRAPTSTEESYATALKLDQYDNVYVTGCSDNDQTECLLQVTVEYGANGGLRWANQLGRGDKDAHAWDLALDSKGNVYVAGDDCFDTDPIPLYDCDYTLACYSGPDVGVARVIAPQDTIRVNYAVTPTIMVKNYSPFPTSDIPVYMFIGRTWYETTLDSLPADDSQVVTFTPWSSPDVGSFPIVAYTAMAGDRENGDDTAYGSVTVVPPWVALDTLPSVKKKDVKDGGALAYDDSLNLIYAVKGNNTTSFYSLGSGDSWVQLESVPVGSGRRRVKAGGAMVYGGNNTVYLAKGSRTAEFWAYSPKSSWVAKANLPGVVKQGTAMAYAPNLGRIYLLPAGNTRHLWYYSLGDTWFTQLPDMPNGPKSKNCKSGTSLAYDGSQYLYALKGGTSEFYAYDVSNNVWSTKDLLPYSKQTGKKRTSNDGSAFAFAGNLLYCLKGNNTDEFWCWSPAADTWTEIDSVLIGPRKKRVKGGGALVSAEGKIYALKGNGTDEFYLYNANIPGYVGMGKSLQPGPNQGQAAPVSLKPALSVAPNPFCGLSAVNYSLPKPAAVSLKLYDVTGRTEIDVFAGRQPAGNYRLSLADPRLAAGVYFLKMRFDDGTGEQQLTTKVLIER